MISVYKHFWELLYKSEIHTFTANCLVPFIPFKQSVVQCYALVGFPISGFQIDAVDQVVLNLQDEVQQTWQPGNQIVVASTDYSMHQAEEFTLLPCPQCTSRQVKIQGKSASHGLAPQRV